MALNPILFTEKIIDSFLKYQLTAYPFEDNRLNRQMKELLRTALARRSPLLKGPYVSLSQSFKQGCAVSQLVQDEILHPHLRQIAPHPQVYGHQERAIRAIISGKTTLVSTGTGSGKSECFLYPAISKALELKDAGAPAGISTVIIYPMNALAEDQLGRLRGLLAGSGISFGMYVGKTPEHESDVTGLRMKAQSSRADYLHKVEEFRNEKRSDTVHPIEEVCSREAMRTDGKQPRILLTNVKQLELLLTRGTDAELFSNATLDYLVFDEAHTFSGIIGAESACLIRRLKAFCGTPDHTVCVATSATIVDKDDPDAAQNFAARFFGDKAERVACVTEEYQDDAWHPENPVPPEPANIDDLLTRVLTDIEKENNAAAMSNIYRELCGGVLELPDWKSSLNSALLKNPIAHAISEILKTPQPLEELAQKTGFRLGGRNVSEAELIIYLVLGAAAVRENRAVFRPVVHAFVRGIPGAVVTFPIENNEPKLWLSGEDEQDACGDNYFRLCVYTCSTCGQHYFIHSLQDFEYSGNEPGGGNITEEEGRYWEPLDLSNDGTRAIFLDKVLYQNEDDDDNPDERKLSVVYLCRHCGALHNKEEGRCRHCARVSPLVKLYAVKPSARQAGYLSSCVSCGAIGRSMGSRFREPIREVRAVNVADVHVLAQDIIHNADRKRLLLFTDSRQDAAFQSGWMKDHARRFRLRAMMSDILRKAGSLSVGDMVFNLGEAFAKDDGLSRALLPEVWARANKESAPAAHESERKQYLTIQVVREITLSSKQRIGLEPWGRMKISYDDLNESTPFVQTLAQRTGLSPDDVLIGVQNILDHLRRQRMVYEQEFNLNNKAFEDGHAYIQNGYMPKPPMPKGVKFSREGSDKPSQVVPFFGPRENMIKQTIRKWGVSDEQMESFIRILWDGLCETKMLVPVTLIGWHDRPLPDCSGVYQLDLNCLLLNRNTGYYKCNHCSRRTLRKTPNNKCMAWRCDGELKYFAEPPDSYDLQILDNNYSLMRPEEHTAMVPQAKREGIEKMFKSDKESMINTLVCTPTLELGVDIGGLDCTLMRNVPPLPANYWQRAGRAGRRNRMAVNVTYCRSLSYDKAYYDNPLLMLEGKVDPPAFNLRNSILIAKHVHAAILTRFNQLSSSGSPLSEPERQEIYEMRRAVFPSTITSYLFDEDGKIYDRHFDTSRFRVMIKKHINDLQKYIAHIFNVSWPEEDTDAVTEQALTKMIIDSPDALEIVSKRLYRRLHWAHDEVTRLNIKRRKSGSLEDEDNAHFKRCDALIKKFKGQLRQRKADSGIDEITTYNVLAVEGFLPGYGLDSGSVKATGEMPFNAGGGILELPRPTAMALREYVPGNLIYANGQKFVPKQYLIETGMDISETPCFGVDREREAIVDIAPGSDAASLDMLVVQTIPICDVELAHQTQISDEEENRWQMPVMIYAQEKPRHNGGSFFDWGGKGLQFRHGVHFRMINAGTPAAPQTDRLGYPICTICGQSISPLSSATAIDTFRKNHEERCGKIPIDIGFYADIVADCMMMPDCENRKEAYSVLEALRTGAAHVLDMHIDDLQILVIGHTDDDKVDAYLWDPMPGGSGLLKQIINNFAEVIEKTLSLIKDCSGACQTACVNCLQTYRNSFYHKQLDRHEAIRILEERKEKLEFQHAIPAIGSVAGSSAAIGAQPVNGAEQKLKQLLEKAGFFNGEWQQQIKFKEKINSPFGGTTPDIFYPKQDPDDDEKGLCIYLDGMSSGIHGNPEAQVRDRTIREHLRSENYVVISIPAFELTDKGAMVVHFKRIAKFLSGRDFANRISSAEWFE